MKLLRKEIRERLIQNCRLRKRLAEANDSAEPDFLPW